MIIMLGANRGWCLLELLVTKAKHAPHEAPRCQGTLYFWSHVFKFDRFGMFAVTAPLPNCHGVPACRGVMF
jgi:hypothetical protein